MESGAFWDSSHGPLDSFAQARQQGLSLTKKLNAPSLPQLRALSPQALIAAAPWPQNTDPTLTSFAPSVDGYILPVIPGTAFANSLQMKVPLLASFNTDEELPFLAQQLPHSTAAQFEHGASLYFGPQNIPKFHALYPDSTPALLNASAALLIGDMTITEHTLTALSLQHSTSGLPRGSTWAYYYTYTSPYSPLAAHTAEIPFVFGNLGPNPALNPALTPASAQDVAMSKIMSAYWTNFAKTGNPNGGGSVNWPAYVGDGAGTGADLLELGDTVAAVDYDTDRLEFLRGFRVDGALPEAWRNVNVSALGS
jgi:para-nitrobenzyl esterase